MNTVTSTPLTKGEQQTLELIRNGKRLRCHKFKSTWRDTSGNVVIGVNGLIRKGFVTRERKEDWYFAVIVK